MITRKFGRKKAHRESMLNNLATSVILYEKVKTTTPKAKEVRKIVEKIINLAKKGDLSSRRQVLSIVKDKNACKKAFDVLAKQYAKKTGGYLTIYSLGERVGDGAPMSLIELIKVETKPETTEKSTVKAEGKTNENK